jgi:hypothetical protein
MDHTLQQVFAWRLHSPHNMRIRIPYITLLAASSAVQSCCVAPPCLINTHGRVLSDLRLSLRRYLVRASCAVRSIPPDDSRTSKIA